MARRGGIVFFWLESSYFCDLGAHAKFRNPTTTPYGVLNNGGEKIKEIKFPLAPMGVLAPGSAHTRPSAQPPFDTSGNLLAQVKQNFQSNFLPFQAILSTFRFFRKPPKQST